MNGTKMLAIPRLGSGWRTCRAILVLALGLMVCLTKASEAVPMGTGWTYQGRLLDANSVADGLYDFEFKLFDDPCTGTQRGSTVDVNNLDVIDGYFTVALDFGSNVFDGNSVWLEIDVRPGDSNDPNAFVSLSPRQEVTPAPHALQTRGIFVDDAGKVGIRTTNPAVTLDVNGDVAVSGEVDGIKISEMSATVVFPAGSRYSRWFDIGETRVLTGVQHIYNHANNTAKTINFHDVTGVPNPCFANHNVVVTFSIARADGYRRIAWGAADFLNWTSNTGFAVRKSNLDYPGGDDGYTIHYTAIGRKP